MSDSQMLALAPPAGGSLRTRSTAEIGRTRVTFLQGECSYRRADSVGRRTAGQVLVLNNPPPPALAPGSKRVIEKKHNNRDWTCPHDLPSGRMLIQTRRLRHSCVSIHRRSGVRSQHPPCPVSKSTRHVPCGTVRPAVMPPALLNRVSPNCAKHDGIGITPVCQQLHVGE